MCLANGLAPQSLNETYRPQSRGAKPVIENARVDMGQQQMGAAAHDTLQKQVQEYCQKNKTRRKQEWESHRTTLEGLRRQKGATETAAKPRGSGYPICSDVTGFLTDTSCCEEYCQQVL